MSSKSFLNFTMMQTTALP